MSDVTILRADRWVDVEAGAVRSPAVVVVAGNQIAAVNPAEPPSGATEIELGDVTLLPGLMDMELNMLIGGPGGPDGLPDPMHGVKDSPVYRTLRGVVNCRTTLMAGFTTVGTSGSWSTRPDSCSTSTWPARWTRGGSPGRASSRRATPSPRPGATSTRRCSRGSRPASCPRAWSRESPTACPKSARRSAIR